MPINSLSADPLQWSIGLVGYGEVGRILAEDLRARGVANLLAYDIKFGTDDDAPLLAHAAQHTVGRTQHLRRASPVQRQAVRQQHKQHADGGRRVADQTGG